MGKKTLKNILHVEDEPDIREITSLALEALGGFSVMSCEDGYVALSKVQTFKPDLILLDVMMPGMDGPETLSRLRRIDEIKDVPVVFMTAKVQAEEKKRLLGLDVSGLIAKPFDPATLALQISGIWDNLKG